MSNQGLRTGLAAAAGALLHVEQWRARQTACLLARTLRVTGNCCAGPDRASAAARFRPRAAGMAHRRRRGGLLDFLVAVVWPFAPHSC